MSSLSRKTLPSVCSRDQCPFQQFCVYLKLDHILFFFLFSRLLMSQAHTLISFSLVWEYLISTYNSFTTFRHRTEATQSLTGFCFISLTVAINSSPLRHYFRSCHHNYPANDIRHRKVPRHVEQCAGIYEAAWSPQGIERTSYGLCGFHVGNDQRAGHGQGKWATLFDGIRLRCDSMGLVLWSVSQSAAQWENPTHNRTYFGTLNLKIVQCRHTMHA